LLRTSAIVSLLPHPLAVAPTHAWENVKISS
jgi:hypothetical protein